MTRKEAKELLPIIQAFAEGKEIEYYDCNDDDWIKTDTPIWTSKINYRIKPEPKYRPFESQEECWNEMHKHPDFGWVRLKINSSLYHIDMVGNNNLIYVDNAYKGLKAVFQSFEFTDGTPFGIKEE